MTRKTLISLLAGLALIVVLPAQAFAAPKPKVNFSKNAYAIAEDDPAGAATITVFRKGNAKRVNQTVTVHYATSDGTAKAGVDYQSASGTLTFAPGDTSETFTVPIINNSTIDGARTVNLKLSSPTGSASRAVLGYPSTATLVIADDDAAAGSGPTFQMAIGSDIASETQGTEPVFIVRSGNLSATATVNYSTADGSAKAGTDYTATSGSANFAAGSDSSAVLVEVDVPILHNPATDPAASDFSFNLSVPGGTTGQLGSPASETITIVNADGTPTLQFGSPTYSVAENGGSVRLMVFMSGSISGNDEVDVDYATADGTAKAGVNYTNTSDTLAFVAGDVAQSFDVPVQLDGMSGDKTFTVGLSNVVGSGVLGANSTATVTILDTDHGTGGSDNGGNGSTGGSGDNGGAGGSTPTDGGNQIVLGAREAGCGLTAKATKKQRLIKQKGLKLTVKTAKACKVTVTTKVTALRSKGKKAQLVRALSFKGKNATLTLGANKAKAVKVKFSKKTLKAINKALLAHKKLVATVVVSTRDSASKVTRKTLKITIKR